MKINPYLVIALAIIGAVAASLLASIGDVEPAIFAAILLFSMLILGWAAGALSSRAEIERLTAIESGQRIRSNCLIVMRNRLEAELENLRNMRGAA